ncbi:LLM class flavin-dependent oxidoreductase [Amycolatopsis sp. lyj-108]|uniref:LLM class flavin-dependent oxidoreductase n=1 Tax=Amycolatopsis sp. lyj-108 TaxID=2789286 RepID=UPI00397B0A24
MEFGISFLPDGEPETKSPVDYYADALALSRLADGLGYSHVKMTEHYLMGYGGYCPSPLNFLSAVAAQTKDIRLFTGCILPVFHHPLKLASYTAMVDAISAGRLDVGFARAYLPYEFEAFGVPMDENRARFEATIDAVIKLWTEEDVSLKTPYFALRDATSLPRPVQQAHPPVYLSAVRTPESFTRIGELGHGLMITPSGLDFDVDQVTAYRDAFNAHHGSSGRRPKVVASLPLYVAETDAEAASVADRYLNEYLRVWIKSTDSWNNASSKDYPSYTGLSRYLKTLTGRDMRTTGSAFVGSPERVTEMVRNYVGALGGVDVILWQVDFGGMPYEISAPSLELFASEVMPKVVGL